MTLVREEEEGCFVNTEDILHMVTTAGERKARAGAQTHVHRKMYYKSVRQVNTDVDKYRELAVQ